MTATTSKNIEKDLRITEQFIANLCLAEATLRPFINDWEHLEAEDEQLFRDCLGKIIELEHKSRQYENYLYKQLSFAPAVCKDGGADADGLERLQDNQPATSGEQDTER